MTIKGTFELSLNGGKHATFKFNLPPDLPQEFKDWFHFTYCNDLLWRHHAGNVGASNGTEYFSMVQMDLYQKFLSKVGDKYLIKEEVER
jgi:hypothetical protein